MSEEVQTETQANQKKTGFFVKLLCFLLILAVVGLGGFFGFVWMTKRGINTAKEVIIEVVAAFNPDEVVETFEEWREISVKATGGNILEIATAEATEKFFRKTNLAMFGKTLPLGTTASEITVPATYRFHIDLNDDWFLTSDGSKLLVLAPKVRPSLPVAFDTGKVEKKTQSGWARWDSGVNLEELEKTITAKLEGRSKQPEVMGKIREEGRISVAKFVKNWLLEKDAWGDLQFTEIVVIFEGEKGQSLSSSPATLKIGEEAEASTLP
jgi:hypothetical protein